MCDCLAWFCMVRWWLPIRYNPCHANLMFDDIAKNYLYESKLPCIGPRRFLNKRLPFPLINCGFVICTNICMIGLKYIFTPYDLMITINIIYEIHVYIYIHDINLSSSTMFLRFNYDDYDIYTDLIYKMKLRRP